MKLDRCMRAARFHGMDRGVAVEEVDYPRPGVGEVVVRIAACGLCGSDVHFLEGMPVPGGLPLTLGHEAAGVVDDVGEAVAGWKPGDRVAVQLGGGCGRCRVCVSGHPTSCADLRLPGLHLDGGFAEAMRVPATHLVRVPDGVSLAAAAVATDCVATPYHALRCRGGMQAGERVAVIGAGGVGGMAVRLAVVLGAERVVAVDRSASALQRAADAGATTALQVDAGEDPTEAVLEACDGGADLVLDCVGTSDTSGAAGRSLRPGGRLVVVGVTMMPPRIDLPQAMFALAELSVLGSFASHREDLEAVLALQSEGRIDIEAAISHRLSLDEVADGLDMLRTRRGGDPQRIVVEPSPACR